jgi:hypothetical protein
MHAIGSYAELIEMGLLASHAPTACPPGEDSAQPAASDGPDQRRTELITAGSGCRSLCRGGYAANEFLSTTAFGAMRVDVVRTIPFLGLELGFHKLSRIQFDNRQALWFPEALIQLQMSGRVVLILHPGGHWLFVRIRGICPTLLPVPARASGLADRWVLRVELRVWSVDP